MQTLRDDHLNAYRSLKLTRDAEGVLVAQFHTNSGPFTFAAQDHTELVEGGAHVHSEYVLLASVIVAGEGRAQELARQYLKAPGVTRRNTRVHFIQPLKERIVREVGDGLSLEGASAAALVQSMRAKS
jgi:hypothetical protein